MSTPSPASGAYVRHLLLAILAILLLPASLLVAQISYVQSNYSTPVGSQTTVTVAFKSPQALGDLNVVVVGWDNSTATVSGVTDTAGNNYLLAIGPTVLSGTASQSIYYAKSIASAAAGANTVKVTFAGSSYYPDVRIAEYSGADPSNPVDVVAGGSSRSGSTANSGSVTTTTAADLLVGANYLQSVTSGPGSGFTSRVITPQDSDILEDRNVTTVNGYQATASLNMSQWWIMQMVAFRASGSGSSPSTEAPTGLTATAASTSSINLSWTAPSSSGLSNYIVQRCQGANCTNFAQVATPTGTTFSDSNLAANTSYTYRVAGEYGSTQSLFSNTATATTQANPSTTVPSNLTAVPASATAINLSWAAPTAGSRVIGYLVQRCQGSGCSNFAQIGTPSATSYGDSNLATNTNYSYRVAARYSRAPQSGYSNIASATTQTVQPPTTPGNLGASAASATRINLSWTASTSAIGIGHYNVQRCQGAGCANFAQIGTAAGATFADTTVTQSTSYTYQVQAVDSAGTTSPFSNPATTSTPAAQPPTAPGSLAAKAVSTSQINLTWTASTSSIGVANYVVQRCQGAGCSSFSQVGTANGTTYSDTSLPSGTSFSYQVIAMDTAGNASSPSSPATTSTLTPQPPTTPGSLTANPAGSTQINLSWTASTSNVGLANYVVQRCQGANCSNFANIGTSSGTSYNDPQLTPSTSYSYQVQAVDTAGNSSQFSNVATTTTASPSSGPVYPPKVSANHRYLVDQTGAPYLLVGDAPHAMFANISLADAATYLQDRKAHGFNALWCEILVYPYVGGKSDGSTYDGIQPFTKGSGGNYDITAPNEAYFQRVDQMINLAASYGMVILLDSFDTGGWMATFESDGASAANTWGQYLGNRYKNFPNIIWITGNDFQTWNTSSGDNTIVQNVMAGIASTDTNHLQTTELNYNISGSLDDSLLVPYTDLAASYTYYPEYYESLKEYNSTAKTVPVFLEETYYDGGSYGNLTPNLATNLMLRKAAYGTVLAGGLAGYMYGTIYYDFHSGWQTGIDVKSATQLNYWKTVITSLPWYNLVPDQDHSVVISGYGTPSGNGSGNMQNDNYVTDSLSPDGSLMMAYCPASTTITVNLSKLKGPATAQWFDPSSGKYTAITGSPFPNSGSQAFTTPGKNSDGDPDWMLVLQTQ